MGCLDIEKTDPVEWRKQEKRIKRKIIAIFISIFILIVILICYRDQIVIVIQNIAVIIGLVKDIRDLIIEHGGNMV